MIDRDQMQAKAVDCLMKTGRVLVQWGTGVGKSRVAIGAMTRILEEDDRAQFLLLVTETAHKLNWEKEICETLAPQLAEVMLAHVRFECYASLKKFRNTEWTMVVADEAHHLRSENRTADFVTLEAEFILMLSATISENGDGAQMMQEIEDRYGEFIDLKFDINDAISHGVLPEPIIRVEAVNLSENAGEYYGEICQRFEQKKKEYFAKREEYGLGYGAPDNDETEALRGAWLYAGNQRKRFIGRVKTWRAKQIINGFERQGKRYICFCSDIKQLEKLGAQNYINSKKSKKANKAVIDAFNNGEINSIFAVGMIQEGVSLKNIQAGLIVQLDGKKRSFVQKLGRVMRSKTPEITVLYAPGTRDEEYLANALEHTEERFIHGWKRDNRIEFGPEGREASQGPFRETELKPATSLVGPTLRPANYTRGDVVILGLNERCDFEGVVGGRSVCSDSVTGSFLKVYAHGNNVEIALRGQNIIYLVSVNWKLSYGLLLPLANMKAPGIGSLNILVRNENGWPRYTLTREGTEIRWAKLQIPKEAERRLSFVNCLIERINKAS